MAPRTELPLAPRSWSQTARPFEHVLDGLKVLRAYWLTGEWATSGLRFSERFPLN